MDHQDLLSRARDIVATSETLGRLLREINAALGEDGSDRSLDTVSARAAVAPLLQQTQQTLADITGLLVTSEALLASSRMVRASSRALAAGVREQRGAHRERIERSEALLARSRALLDQAGRGGSGEGSFPGHEKGAAIAPLLRKLQAFGPLPDAARQVLGVLPLNPRRVQAGRDLVRDGERVTHCLLLIEGWACRYKTGEDGKRRIVAFYLPGDIVDLTGLLSGASDHCVGALTPVKVAAIPHATVLGWTQLDPDLRRLLWRDTLIETAMAQEWVINISRRDAYQRTAHQLCELVARMRTLGLARDNVHDLVSQRKLAEALGLSNVHINRVIQRLRKEGLIELKRTTLVVRDWEALKRAGGFDPTYLHLSASAPLRPDGSRPGDAEMGVT